MYVLWIISRYGSFYGCAFLTDDHQMYIIIIIDIYAICVRIMDDHMKCFFVIIVIVVARSSVNAGS